MGHPVRNAHTEMLQYFYKKSLKKSISVKKIMRLSAENYELQTRLNFGEFTETERKK